jgi:hypothetical protein
MRSEPSPGGEPNKKSQTVLTAEFGGSTRESEDPLLGEKNSHATSEVSLSLFFSLLHVSKKARKRPLVASFGVPP